jgi:hypothetical protein
MPDRKDDNKYNQKDAKKKDPRAFTEGDVVNDLERSSLSSQEKKALKPFKTLDQAAKITSRKPVPRSEENEENEPEIILTEEVGFDRFSTLMDESTDDTPSSETTEGEAEGDESLNKTRILTEDELKDVEEKKGKSSSSKKEAGSGTSWVDDLLSDIVIDDDRKSQKPISPKAATSVPKDKTKEDLILLQDLAPTSEPPRKPTPLGESLKKKTGNTPIGGMMDSKRSTGSFAAVTPVIPQLDPVAQPEPIIQSVDQDQAGSEEKSSIKEQLGRLKIEIDEIMNIQTRILKLTLELNDKIDKIEVTPSPGFWKKITGLYRRK